jgi:hypothetical protein
VRVGFDVTVRMLACVSRPPRSPPGHADKLAAREGLAVGLGLLLAGVIAGGVADAVVPGEGFVQVGELPVHEVEEAAILAHNLAEEELRLA